MTVDRYMAALVHARKPEVERLVALLREALPGVPEEVKWNAPSFGDRVTLRLHPKDVVQVVFHRGAKAKDVAGFTFEDPTGRVKWAAVDRGTLVFQDAADLEALAPALPRLVGAWVEATTP